MRLIETSNLLPYEFKPQISITQTILQNIMNNVLYFYLN